MLAALLVVDYGWSVASLPCLVPCRFYALTTTYHLAHNLTKAFGYGGGGTFVRLFVWAWWWVGWEAGFGNSWGLAGLDG